jgi:hypothetical protein
MDAIRERYSSDAAACREAIPQRFSDLDAYMKSLSIDPSALSRTFALTPSETGPVPMNAAVAAALERTQVNWRGHTYCRLLTPPIHYFRISNSSRPVRLFFCIEVANGFVRQIPCLKTSSLSLSLSPSTVSPGTICRPSSTMQSTLLASYKLG